MTGTTYVPGGSVAIVAGQLRLLAAASLEGIDDVWRLATSGDVDVTTVLDAIAGNGFAAMPGFAMAVRSRDAVRLVVRGGYVAEVEGAGGVRRFEASGVATWAEHRLSPGDALLVRLAATDEASPDRARAWPIQAGVVYASTIVLGSVAASSVAALPPIARGRAGEAAAVSARDELPREEPPNRVPASEEPAGEAPPQEAPPRDEAPPEESPGEEPSRELAPPDVPAAEDPSPSAPVVVPQPAVTPDPAPQPAASAVPDAAADSGETLIEPEDSRFDAMFGVTIAGRRPEDAAVRNEDDPAPTAVAPLLPQVEAVQQRPGDHDNRTVTRAELRRARGDVDAAGAEPAAPAGPSITLSLSTGREVLVNRPVVVGRAPQARNASGTTLPILVTVDDQYVSSTHLEVKPVGDSLMVTDVSSNGTVLKRPDAPAVPMRKGEPTQVVDGAVLQISDDVSISVSVS